MGMDVDFTKIDQNTRYKLLTALVIPRPIAWITTMNESGSVNAAPYSFFNVMGNRPPVVAIGPGDRPNGELKDTPRNIERTREFVVNLVDEDCAEQMHASAAPFAPGSSETENLSIPTSPSSHLKTPSIAVSKVHLECTYHSTVIVGENRIVLGIVAYLHAADGVIDPETYRTDPNAFAGVGRLQGPGYYCRTVDRFDLGRFPRVP